MYVHVSDCLFLQLYLQHCARAEVSHLVPHQSQRAHKNPPTTLKGVDSKLVQSILDEVVDRYGMSVTIIHLCPSLPLCTIVT